MHTGSILACVSTTPVQRSRCDHTAVVLQRYAHGLGNCLMELQHDSNSPALKQLQTWVVEMESLFVSIVLSSPGRLKEVNNSRMDEGRVCPADRPADFYPNLLVGYHSSSCPSQHLTVCISNGSRLLLHSGSNMLLLCYLCPWLPANIRMQLVPHSCISSCIWTGRSCTSVQSTCSHS